MFAPVFKLSDYASPARSKAALTAATNRAGDISKGVGPRASQAELDDLDRFADLVTEHRERQSKRFDGSRSADNPDTSIATKAVGGRVELPSPSRMSTDEWRDAFECATQKKNFRAELKTKAAISGIGLPAVADPSLTLGLGYEPDRLFAHLPSKAVDYPTVEYYSHTSNTNPAAVVAELGQKPDLGMVLTPKTATVTKIAALASASLEALTDFETFVQFIPTELTRAVVDAETAFVAAQILGTSGALKARPKRRSTPSRGRSMTCGSARPSPSRTSSSRTRPPGITCGHRRIRRGATCWAPIPATRSASRSGVSTL